MTTYDERYEALKACWREIIKGARQKAREHPDPGDGAYDEAAAFAELVDDIGSLDEVGAYLADCAPSHGAPN